MSEQTTIDNAQKTTKLPPVLEGLKKKLADQVLEAPSSRPATS